MATLFMANGTIKHVVPENGKTFTLEELQQHVGGYVELIPGVKHLLQGCMMLADEEALIKDPKPQINVPISVWIQHHNNRPSCIVRGNVLLLTPLEMGE